MKIALVIERFDPQSGGAERSTAQIAQELVKAGHDATILAGAVGSPEHIEGYQVKTLGIRGSYNALKMYRFNRWVRQELETGGYDASLSVTTTAPASVIQPRCGTMRETFTRHVAVNPSIVGRMFKRLMLLLTPKRQMVLALEKRTLRDPRVKHFAAISRYVADQLTQGFGIDPQKVTLIPNAAAMPVMSPEDRQRWRTDIRQSFNVPAGATAYVFAAFDPRRKGADTLLRATKILQDRGMKDFVVLMAGTVGYRQQKLAGHLGIRDHVRFIGSTKHMARLYVAGDVTVLPTFYDPASKVIIESLMLGVPAISTRYNGASDMILPGQGVTRGRVIDNPADATELADAMQQLADPAARKHCQAMCAGLNQSLSMATHVRGLIQLFEAIAKAKPDVE